MRFRPVAQRNGAKKAGGSVLHRPTVAVSTSLDGKFKVCITSVH